MGSVQILLGRSRWRRKRALPAEALSGVDAWGRPTFLYITDTQRKRQVVEREFVGLRGSLCFSPEISVVSELLDALHIRHGRGAALLSPRTESLLAWRMLQANPDRWPWLQSLGADAAVAEALAEVLRSMREARRHDLGDVPHADELNDALRSLDTAQAAVPGYITRSAAHEDLLKLLQRPSAALIQWLRATHSVVLDDILQPSPLRRELLLALCRAWSEAGTHVVMSFETGRDLGGDEVGLFFEYEDLDDVSYAMRPFAVTRGLRRAAFSAFVAQGSSPVYIALRERVLQVDPGMPADDPSPADLSDYLYGPRPIPVHTAQAAQDLLADTVVVRCHADRTDEVRAIARAVKSQVLRGVALSDCVVAFPDLLSYAPLVRAVFLDHGLPIELSAGGRLAWSPVARTVLHAATVALGGWQVEQVLALLRTDLVQTDAAIDLDALGRWCGSAGVREGLPLTWWPRLQRWMRQARLPQETRDKGHEWLQSLQNVLAGLDRLTEPATPTAWRQTLLDLVTGLKVPQRAAEVGAGRVPDEITGANLDAWGETVRALDGLVRDLNTASREPWPAQKLADVLGQTLADTRWQPRVARRDAVQVVGVLELRGLTPGYTWLGGISQGAFPRPEPSSFLIPSSVRRRLEASDAGAEARYIFCSLLRNALDDRYMHHLELSWPATVAGRPSPPAPVLEDLLSLPTRVPDASRPGGMHLLGDLIVQQDHANDALAWSRSDALRQASRHPAWQKALQPAEATSTAWQASQHQARTAPHPGVHEGVLQDGPAQKIERLGVTSMESYLRCPAAFWYKQHLSLAPDEPWSPEVRASERGQTLHSILETFLRRRLGKPIRGDRTALAAELHTIAEAEIKETLSSGNAARPLVQSLLVDWTAGLVDNQPAGVLSAWLDDELAHSHLWAPHEVEGRHQLALGPITLSAQLDRIDHTRSGDRVVVDYKSGRAPRAAHVTRGLVLQPVAYAAIAAAASPGCGVASAYVELKAPETVKRKGWVGEATVLHDLDAGRSAIELDAAQREHLLNHARHAAQHLGRGTFHTTLAEPKEAGCRYCDFRRICRWSASRSQELRDSEADLFRPLPIEDVAP